MRGCEIPTGPALPNPVYLQMGRSDFEGALKVAKDTARSYCTDPMLLSWYDRAKGMYSPHEAECCAEGKPSWVTYAKSRGGNLTVDINHEDYVFIFRGKQSHEGND